MALSLTVRGILGEMLTAHTQQKRDKLHSEHNRAVWVCLVAAGGFMTAIILFFIPDIPKDGSVMLGICSLMALGYTALQEQRILDDLAKLEEE